MMIQEVFIIDDDHISQFITKQLVKSEGLANKITAFLDAEEALEFLKQDGFLQAPDLIFLDLNMPFLNGWQFLDALKPFVADFQNKTKIYILTSSVDAADQEKAGQYDFIAGFLHKPLHPRDIAGIKASLNKHSV